MKLVVGLGNPGTIYQETRHNIGFMFVDDLSNKLNLRFTLNKQLKCEITDCIIGGEKVIIIKPQTFMNLSGEAVLAVKNYYKIDVDDIIVVFDDLDLPVGKVRIRRSGSSGGHKGIANIIDLLKTSNIKRIRIGIQKTNNIDTVDYVLGKLSEEQKAIINKTIDKSKNMIESFVKDSFDDFMNKFNRSDSNE